MWFQDKKCENGALGSEYGNYGCSGRRQCYPLARFLFIGRAVMSSSQLTSSGAQCNYMPFNLPHNLQVII
jgi:hypothetical protein